ncbi:hypothetical protein AM493_06735 [Flavobacterium akiainvivens]|uniref:ABM domain-containing protein n=1 Tax=Flavobacterium akiainvivens TaxID=1202724 RepID=A0A0M8MA48_9FLAO|nr:antibiotic biosynthesis monooxygenase family protein [Flavobacterium akiainvivens]KOS05765.1 hypothetical protein AM493_06735 [Flavobacterium akiainvivens]SFQ77508.1 Quinol monooxygenase YgiN [Flavobacterium akiainvivens]
MDNTGKRKSLYKGQPGVVLKMQAKEGKGDELFEVATDLHYNGDVDGPVDWVLCRTKNNPDVLWAFEFYKDDASFERHYSNPAMDEGHQRILDLLGEMPMRADVEIVSSDKTDR